MNRRFLFLLLGLIGQLEHLRGEEARPAIDQLTPLEIKTTWEKLNSLILKSGGIDASELERARLQGVLQKLGKNACLSARQTSGEIATGVDFRQEMLPRSILYANLGDLAADNISQLADSLRKEAKATAVILDLRATRGAASYDQAASLISLFAGNGKTFFSLVSGGASAGKNFQGSGDALFGGIVIVLVNEDANGAAEVAASALHQQIHALVVGTRTAGRALEFDTLPINLLIDLEVAVGRIILPGLPADFLEDGVRPDISVPANIEGEREILARSEKEGMTPFIFEIERPHLNEASLVAGKNPELDSYQARKAARAAAENSESPPLLDRSLQRALDAATSLLVLRESGKTGG